MPKRRRLLLKSPMKKSKNDKDDGMSSARGRFKGALLDQLEPSEEESESTPEKKSETVPGYRNRSSSNEYEQEQRQPKINPCRQSYVLKLFDRSVDLSQFQEDSPLYPICRAWIANQPKADYSAFGKTEPEESEETNSMEEQNIELPGPRGPSLSRIPQLLPIQKTCDKKNINLDYSNSTRPSKLELLSSHMNRWTQVRHAWLKQAAKVEARYSDSQAILNRIISNTSP